MDWDSHESLVEDTWLHNGFKEVERGKKYIVYNRINTGGLWLEHNHVYLVLSVCYFIGALFFSLDSSLHIVNRPLCKIAG